MKELRFFYTPDPSAGQLPADEAQHALRVLRLQMGEHSIGPSSLRPEATTAATV